MTIIYKYTRTGAFGAVAAKLKKTECVVEEP